MKQSLTLFQNLKSIFLHGRWPKVESWDYVSWVMEYRDGTIIMNSPSSEKARMRKGEQPKYFTLYYEDKKLIDRMEIPKNHAILYRYQVIHNVESGITNRFLKLALWDRINSKYLIHYWFENGRHEIMKHWGPKPFNMPVLRDVEII